LNATDPSGSNDYIRAVYTFTTEDFFDSFETGEWNGLWVEDIQDA